MKEDCVSLVWRKNEQYAGKKNVESEGMNKSQRYSSDQKDEPRGGRYETERREI